MLLILHVLLFAAQLGGLVDEGRAVGGVYFHFSEASDTVSQNILTDKLMKYRLNKQKETWSENWLNCQAQMNAVRDTSPASRQSLDLRGQYRGESTEGPQKCFRNWSV